MSNTKQDNKFDAIVIGSGISGGWAAKELTEKGLKTLVLERGRDVKHLTQNPSLTYMALTARAVDHVIGELKK